MKSVTRFCFALSLCPLAACGKIWTQPQGNPTSYGQSASMATSAESLSNYPKTGLGVATGAALGAVTGLALGSTTGNAGQGFLVGATIGAAAGAGVGSALDKQDQKLSNDRTRINQQGQRIEQQGQEIQRLRESVNDGQFPISQFNAPSIGRVSPQAYSGNPSAQPFGNSRARMAGTGMTRTTVAEIKESNLAPTQTRPALMARADSAPTATAPTAMGAMAPSAPQPTFAPTQNTPFAAGANSMGVGVGSKATAPMPTTMVSPPEPRLVNSQGATLTPPPSDTMARATTTQNLGTATSGMASQGSAGMASAGMGASAALPPANQIPPAKSAETLPSAVSSLNQQRIETKIEEKKKPVASATAARISTAKSPEVAQAAKTTEKTNVAPKTVSAEKPKTSATTPVVTAKATTEPSAGTTPDKGDDTCGQANKEAARGREATSDADKLFYFRRAIRLCPSQPEYYVEVGRVYVTIGRTEDAQHEFNKALELDPENEAAQNELSMIMLGAAY